MAKNSNWGLVASPVSAPRFEVVPPNDATWFRVTRRRGREDPSVVLGFSEVDGRSVLSGICITSTGELTVKRYRNIPIGDLADQARHATGKAPRGPKQAGASGPRRGNRKEFGWYVEIAELYRDACHREPQAPVRWIAEAMFPDAKTREEREASSEKVRRWVRTARRTPGVGLGPSIPGKAGERTAIGKEES